MNRRAVNLAALALVAGMIHAPVCADTPPGRTEQPVKEPSLEESFRWLKEKIDTQGYTVMAPASRKTVSYKVERADGVTLVISETHRTRYTAAVSILTYTVILDLKTLNCANVAVPQSVLFDDRKFYSVLCGPVVVAAKDPEGQVEKTTQDRWPLVIFTDEKLADRVAKALAHAVKLAKEKKEPF
ncbi:MAG: hypothetical protein ACO1SX_23970 [Actinomycetota bacterium]